MNGTCSRCGDEDRPLKWGELGAGLVPVCPSCAEVLHTYEIEGEEYDDEDLEEDTFESTRDPGDPDGPEAP